MQRSQIINPTNVLKTFATLKLKRAENIFCVETALRKSKNVKDVSMTAPEIGLLTSSDFTDMNEKWRRQVQMEEIMALEQYMFTHKIKACFTP